MRELASKFDMVAQKVDEAGMEEVPCHLNTVYNHQLPGIEEKLIRLSSTVELEISAAARGHESPGLKRQRRAK